MTAGVPASRRRELGVGAVLASLAMALSYAALGITSIAVSRLVGPDGAGLLALSNQVVLITVLVAGIGLRTGLAATVGGGEWSVRAAVRSAMPLTVALGLLGSAAGFGLYRLLEQSAFEGFTAPMAVALMAALPGALLWWVVPALALARERYEAYSLLTISAPAAVMLVAPLAAALEGEAGAVFGLATAYLVGGGVCLAWALRFAARGEARRGRERRLARALSVGARSWVNDLFQIVNLRPDLFILNAYASTAETGIYAVAIAITSAGFILSQSLATVVLPRAAALRAPTLDDPVLGERTAASAVRHAVIVSVVAVLGLGLFLLAVPLLWGGDFADTVGYGLILLPGVALLGVGRVMVASFTGRGHPHYALAVGLVSLPATVIAYLLVIPSAGAGGAAVVSSASYVAAALLAAVLFFRTVRASIREVLVPTRADVRDYYALLERLAFSIRGRT